MYNKCMECKQKKALFAYDEDSNNLKEIFRYYATNGDIRVKEFIKKGFTLIDPHGHCFVGDGKSIVYRGFLPNFKL